MTDFNEIIRKEINKALEDSLSGIKNAALRNAIQDATYDSVIVKISKTLPSQIKSAVLESIEELTTDIKTTKTSRAKEATQIFSGGKTSLSGSKTSPKPLRRRSYGGKDSGSSYGGK